MLTDKMTSKLGNEHDLKLNRIDAVQQKFDLASESASMYENCFNLIITVC